MTSQPDTARTVEEAFRAFIEALALDRAEVTAARDRHNAVRDCLTATQLVSTSFLQGSFARKTMISPLHDVDVVLILPAADQEQLSAPGGAALSMERLKQPLRECFPGVVFDSEKKADHALRLDFSDTEFHIDLVPAFETSGSDDDVLIADRGKDTWEWSNSRSLIRAVAERNADTDGRLIHQVRMLKTFTSQRPELKICGLVGEAIAFDAIERKLDSPQALLLAFQRGTRLTSGTLTDPTGVDPLLKDWTWERKQQVSAHFGEAARLAQEAIDLAAGGDDPGAISIWRELLGDDFPSPFESGSERALFQNWKGVTSGNRITPAVAAAAVAAPPTRAHRSS